MDYDNHSLSAAETIFALRERVKELTCLYRITDLANRSDLGFEEFMAEVLKVIPRSMQYPSATGCRIQVDGINYESPNIEQGSETIMVPISAHNQIRGSIQLFYQDSANVKFIPEEELLLKSVAVQLALVLERKKTEEDGVKLQEQLRFADRLATIGQLSAGIAHEISEPLSGILEFGKRTKTIYQIPPDAETELQTIIASALHARDVVRKLMLFARQVPPSMCNINLNKLIEESFYFLENSCVKQGINLVRELQDNLPDILADSSLMQQVLVNLCVNAIQAMPNGGILTICTSATEETVELQISDTGSGMDEELVKKIFVPFFTTKDAEQGTGLGLPVVHGIITAHHGKIRVDSYPDKGTTIHISLKINQR